MRHATASMGEESDHARALSAEGMAEARRVGEDWPPDLAWPEMALCSDARRTQETLQCMGERRGFAQIAVESGLYMGMPDLMSERIQRVDANVRSLLLLAHNPGVHQLALALLSDAEMERQPWLGRQLAQGFAPAGLCVFHLPERQTWAELGSRPILLAALRRSREGWMQG